MSHFLVPVPKDQPALMDQSGLSVSRKRSDRIHCSFRSGASMSRSATYSASVHNHPTPSNNSDGRSLPDCDILNQLQNLSLATYKETDEQGEESDYYNESTPGRAWRKTGRAVPRVRVVGFNAGSPILTPKSPGNDVPSCCQSKQPPNSISTVSSGSSRRSAMPERSGLLHDRRVHLTADEPCSYLGNISSTSQNHDTSYERSINHSSDLYSKKTMAKPS